MAPGLDVEVSWNDVVNFGRLSSFREMRHGTTDRSNRVAYFSQCPDGMVFLETIVVFPRAMSAFCRQNSARQFRESFGFEHCCRLFHSLQTSRSVNSVVHDGGHPTRASQISQGELSDEAQFYNMMVPYRTLCIAIMAIKERETGEIGIVCGHPYGVKSFVSFTICNWLQCSSWTCRTHP